jgi:hypothetical protein
MITSPEFFILRHSEAPGQGRMDRIYVMYSQSVLGNPSRGRGLHTAAISKMVNLKCVFLGKYLTDFLYLKTLRISMT